MPRSSVGCLLYFTYTKRSVSLFRYLFPFSTFAVFLVLSTYSGKTGEMLPETPTYRKLAHIDRKYIAKYMKLCAIVTFIAVIHLIIRSSLDFRGDSQHFLLFRNTTTMTLCHLNMTKLSALKTKYTRTRHRQRKETHRFIYLSIG